MSTSRVPQMDVLTNPCLQWFRAWRAPRWVPAIRIGTSIATYPDKRPDCSSCFVAKSTFWTQPKVSDISLIWPSLDPGSRSPVSCHKEDPKGGCHTESDRGERHLGICRVRPAPGGYSEVWTCRIPGWARTGWSRASGEFREPTAAGLFLIRARLL